jgi:hypothetical protein
MRANAANEKHDSLGVSDRNDIAFSTRLFNQTLDRKFVSGSSETISLPEPFDNQRDVITDQIFNDLVSSGVPKHLPGVRRCDSNGQHAGGSSGLDADWGVFEDHGMGRMNF